MPRFCPTCGNSSDKEKFYGNFCMSCARGMLKERLPKAAEIRVCKRCGSIKVAGRYMPDSARSIEGAIKPFFGRMGLKVLRYKGGSADIEVSEASEHGNLSVEYEIEIDQKRSLCDTCYKKACSYYEAVIQLRGNNYKIARFIERVTRFLDINNGFVTKVERNDNGSDVYVSSKKLASAFISRMRIHPTASYTLAGVKKGKRIYKNTYAIRYE